MATQAEIDGLIQFVQDSFDYVNEILPHPGIFRDDVADHVGGLRMLIEQERQFLIGGPIEILERTRNYPNAGRGRNLNSVGLSGNFLAFKLQLANDFLGRQMSPANVKTTMEVVITILDSLQKALGLVVEPLIELYKLILSLL